jgi:hypothetical protein
MYFNFRQAFMSLICHCNAIAMPLLYRYNNCCIVQRRFIVLNCAAVYYCLIASLYGPSLMSKCEGRLDICDRQHHVIAAVRATHAV